MSYTKITTMRNAGGPEVPSELHADIGAILCPGSGTVLSTLLLTLGSDYVEIWPADPEMIRGLIADLEKVFPKLEEFDDEG